MAKIMTKADIRVDNALFAAAVVSGICIAIAAAYFAATSKGTDRVLPVATATPFLVYWWTLVRRHLVVRAVLGGAAFALVLALLALGLRFVFSSEENLLLQVLILTALAISTPVGLVYLLVPPDTENATSPPPATPPAHPPD